MMSANHTPEKLKKIQDADEASQTRSLPLLHDFKTQLYTLGIKPGMECMPLRSPPGPYHYHHHVVDQTKSLQELQNEVGALLEFRDLVIETFPDLKSKMVISPSSSTIPSSSSLRREWEPGIRVRRKIGPKESNSETVSSLSRSRSNSQSSKQQSQQQQPAKEPKSGEGNGSVVQDSGFSTETSSSKETHSASSTTGASQGAIATNRLTSDTEDELWNLLDVIHRKSNRLREEVEHLRTIERDKCSGKNGAGLQPSQSFQNVLLRAKPEDVQILRKERDRLLDKLSEMEAETLSCKIKESKMQDEMEVVIAAKRDLEEQLKAAISQKLELNSKLNDLGIHMMSRNSDISTCDLRQQRLPQISRNLSNDITSSSTGASDTPATSQPQLIIKTHPNTYFTPVVLSHNKSQSDINKSSIIVTDGSNKLGYLDGVLSSPTRIPRLKKINSNKISAILQETNIIELQRHLLTITVQNQVLQEKLEKVLKSRTFLSKQLDKSKEDIEDLRFQLEEKSIELEGARAQLRVIESKSLSKSEYGSPEQTPTRSAVMLPPVNALSSLMKTPNDSQTSLYRDANQISTPSMKAMIPLGMDDATALNHSSSTESAQDHAEVQTPQDMVKHRPPSKIPLPGQKGYVAPRPPSAKSSVTPKNPSGPPSNRSLSKSTGSLQVIQVQVQMPGPTSITNKNLNPSPNRCESAQSWRNKDVSLERQRNTSSSNGSSIPISSNNRTTIKLNTSPVLPRVKRDSLTSRVKNLDSLSRHLSQSSLNNSSNLPSTTTTTTSTTSNNKTKKDLISSFTTAAGAGGRTYQQQQQPTAPMRRISSSSVHRHHHPTQSSINNHINKTNNSNNTSNNTSSQKDATETASDANKVFIRKSSFDEKPENTCSSSRQLLEKYLAKNRQPPAIFQTGLNSINNCFPAMLYDETLETENPSTRDERDRDTEVKYIEDNSVEVIEADDDTHSVNRLEPNIVPVKNTAFESMTRPVNKEKSPVDTKCRLVGKVNPNIVRTWEQLNSILLRNQNSLTTNSVDSDTHSNDKQSFTLFCRKPFNFKEVEERLEKYPVRKIRYTESGSDDFFDSIDHDSLIEKLQHVSDDHSNEIDDNLMMISEAAGEGMADFDSLEKHKHCWSIDDDE